MALEIDVSRIAKAVLQTTAEYSEKLAKHVNASVDAVAEEAVRELERTSPKAKGNYAKGWAKKVTKGKEGAHCVVSNEKYGNLTQLLEFSHIVKNAFGQYGRTKAAPHILPAQEHAKENLIEAITEFKG